MKKLSLLLAIVLLLLCTACSDNAPSSSDGLSQTDTGETKSAASEIQYKGVQLSKIFQTKSQDISTLFGAPDTDTESYYEYYSSSNDGYVDFSYNSSSGHINSMYVCDFADITMNGVSLEGKTRTELVELLGEPNDSSDEIAKAEYWMLYKYQDYSIGITWFSGEVYVFKIENNKQEANPTPTPTPTPTGPMTADGYVINVADTVYLPYGMRRKNMPSFSVFKGQVTSIVNGMVTINWISDVHITNPKEYKELGGASETMFRTYPDGTYTTQTFGNSRTYAPNDTYYAPNKLYKSYTVLYPW